MKKITKILVLASAMSLFAVVNSQAQVIVRVRPSRPATYVARRPSRPSPRHVWVAEEWTPGGGSYAYHAGYWALPPRPHAIWVAGKWRHSPRGYVWVAGHWN